MTTRRLNWTSRKRISRESVAIALQRADGRTAFSADLRLTELRLPPDSRVVVEAYRQTGYMRFDYGSVGLVAPPHSTWLSNFEPAENVLFRVKVLGTGPLEGRILAEADQLRPTDPEERLSTREPLLIPRGDNLGEEVWRIVIDDGAQAPELLVNSELGDWRSIAISPHFIWFVYPQVFRQILTVILEGDIPDEADTQGWRSRWLRFAAGLPGLPRVPEEGSLTEERSIWIESAVQAFCRALRFKDRFQTLVLGGE